MTLEERYTEQLRELGIYRPAFDAEIKLLAQMERELRRMSKAWRAEGSDYSDPLYSRIAAARRDILAHRDSLGLTPRGFKRLRPEEGSTGVPQSAAFAAAIERLESQSREMTVNADHA